jgi:hypothetical protein
MGGMMCTCEMKPTRIPGGWRLTKTCSCSVHAAAAPEKAPGIPSQITALLKQHGIVVNANTQPFDVRFIDTKLHGKRIEDRMMIKSALRQVGLLA